jgi:methyl-accepting chemotaxis protein
MAADAWQIDGNSEHLDEARQLVAGAVGQANGLADHFGLNDGKDSADKQTIRRAIGVVKGQFDVWLAAFEEAASTELGGDPGNENLASAGTALQQQTEGLRAALRSARNTVRHRSMILIVVVAAAAVAIGLVLAMILTRSILVPLNKCTATLVALRDGRDPEPCDVQSQDEFGQMAGAINDLIATCRQPLREQPHDPQPV